jgi:hypothetical protein
MKEKDVVLESSFYFIFFFVLDPSPLVVRGQPPCNKIVIISMKIEDPPAFSLEIMKEHVTLKDLRSEGARASGYTRSATIHAMCSGSLKFVVLDICGS